MRKKGDGSFRKLSNGSFEYSVSVGYDVYGKRQRKRFYGKTEVECRKKYKEFIKGGEKETNKTKEYILSDWMDVYIETYKKDKVQESTYKEYRYLAEFVKKHDVSSLKLHYVKPMHITDFFTSIMDYSQSIRKRIRSLLYGAPECAVDNDFINQNPVNKAVISTKSHGEKESFSENDVKRILDFAKTDKYFGIPIQIMLNTGIRSGEMRALKVEKIDFEKGMITIDSAVKETGELGKPKNGKTRVIPITQSFSCYLKEKLGNTSGYIIGGYYYVSSAGFRSRYNHFFKRMNKTFANLGEKPAKKKSPHMTRHTFGTLLQKNGMPIAMVSELLGHSSISVTEVYTHFKDFDILKEAVEKYQALA